MTTRPDPTPGPDALREAIDAVADALNAWDQGEEPRPDTHRHWLHIVAALSGDAESGLDRERLRTVLRDEMLCVLTEGEHHTEEYIDGVLAAYDRLPR